MPNGNGKDKNEELEVKTDPRSPIISSVELGRVLVEALGLQDVPVSRVIIDVDCNVAHPVVVVIEGWATEELESVPWNELLDGVKAQKYSTTEPS